MSKLNGLPANFTISQRAKAAIADLRQLWDASDPAELLCIAWGDWHLDTGEVFGNVVVSYYGRSQAASVRHGIETVSGLDLVFFITAENYHRFRARVLDHTPERSFFLA